MEPNKLEQDFKQKLEQRTIQPTEMAWDRLDAMLSVSEEEKKKKPSRTWMYMAASFLALLLVGVLFLNQENQNDKDGFDTNNNTVTEGKSEQNITLEPTVTPTIITNPAIKQQETVAVTTTTNNQAPAKKVITKKETAKSNVAPVVNNEAVASVTINEDVVKVKTGPAKITVNAANLLASVDGSAVTEQVAVGGKTKKSVKVDPNSLLTSVEGELNESFRGKVLQSVAKNYNIIKSSVASRNRQ